MIRSEIEKLMKKLEGEDVEINKEEILKELKNLNDNYAPSHEILCPSCGHMLADKRG